MSDDVGPATGTDPGALLRPAQIRHLAAELGIRPTKRWGQNFVTDANTIRRIVRLAGVGPLDDVVEVGPGLGSLTLALLQQVRSVTAIEVDPVLAAALPETARQLAGAHADALTVLPADALTVHTLPDPQPSALVANLPYNVSVPVLLVFLQRFASLRRALVMVQLEVAQRLAAAPGTKAYGVPSAKAAWYADARLVGRVPRTVFWPVPRVDSGLVALARREPPDTSATRAQVFACVEAAFAQRRKTARAALAGWAGGAARAERILRAAGVDPGVRGERLSIADFARVAAGRTS